MKYFFILGSNPALSTAELAAVFNHGGLSLIQKNIAILDTDSEIKPEIIKKIGGTIKFGLIREILDSFSEKNILKSLTSFAMPEKNGSKFNFGISYYGKTRINIKVLGMEFKKMLKQSGINSRWVISKDPCLSSVVVEQNKLTTDKGAEIAIIEFNKKMLLGKTIAVQPFKQLSFRDYGRPARDHRSGMLPPKLAQIMINLSRAEPDSAILDPFCGSGTIITEAMLMGFKNIIGSDISEKAIQDSSDNAEWISAKFKIPNSVFRIFKAGAARISEHLPPDSVGAIITEPYLGPQRGKIEIKKTKAALEKLYSESLREFKKILKPNGKIIMAWPVFISAAGVATINPDINGFIAADLVPEPLQNSVFIKLTSRDSVIYGREGQKIWREIIMLEKPGLAR